MHAPEVHDLILTHAYLTAQVGDYRMKQYLSSLIALVFFCSQLEGMENSPPKIKQISKYPFSITKCLECDQYFAFLPLAVEHLIHEHGAEIRSSEFKHGEWKIIYIISPDKEKA
jgi:hypothetical protein